MAEIRQTFEVGAPPPVVWAFFQDAPRVAPCMPGAELLEVEDADTFRGKLRVKVGPITAEFEGHAKVVERDEAAHRSGIEASGVDRRGGSRGSATITYELSPAGDGTRVELVAEYRLQGAMAQFGRTGLIQEMSARLTREFADCLQQRLEAETPEQEQTAVVGAVKGIRLFFKSLWTVVARFFRRLFRGQRPPDR
jgi:carbon monoxide dehydrogenase subunit G